MAQLDRVVEVQISRQTQQINISSFDIPLLLVRVDEAETVMPNRVETFTSLEGVADMFGEDHAAFKMSVKLLSGDLRPAEWRIGKVAYSSAPVAVVLTGVVGSTIEDPTNYTIEDEPEHGVVVINSATGEYTYTSEIGYNGEDSFSVNVTNAEADEEVVEILLEVSQTEASETYAQGLVAALAADNSWYCLLAEAKFDQDIFALANIIQSQKKIYVTSSDDVNISSTLSNSDLGAQLKQAGLDRTSLIYLTNASEYPEATLVGSQLVEQPGSNTWTHKGLPGTKVDKLTDSQITALESKNVNYFVEIGGAPSFETGVMSSGEWIDTIIFVDWLTAKIQENVWYLFRNRKKVPMTRSGATMIEARIRSVLALGVQVGGIADDTPVTVVSPDPLSIPEQERGSRMLGDFLFDARLAGAVHRTRIRGTVSY